MTQENNAKALAYSVEEFCRACGGISRTTFYKLVSEGEITPFKFGARTLVDAKEAEDLIARKRAASRGGSQAA